MHNGRITGLITSLSSYPIKYLKEFFVPCGFSSSVYLDYFFVFIKVTFLISVSPKSRFFPLSLILDEKKSKFFYNDLGVQGVIAYFTVGLNESYFNIMA